MSWRTVVITGVAKLDYKMDYLVVRKKDSLSKVYLGEISILILESTAISLTAVLLSELVKKKVKVIFCDEKHNPQAELIPYYGSHDTGVKVKNQIHWSDEKKKELWTEIVREKIKKQMEHLYRLSYQEQGDLLAQYLVELKLGDESNREGHAAKVYFNALFGLDFSRSLEIPTNAALNYGYGILLAAFNREIVANGYITQLGLFHSNMFNPFNFSSDLMEPFRILVDKKVVELQRESFQHFGSEEKVFLLNMLNDEVFLDGKQQTVNNAIKIYCRSVLDALNEGDISLMKFYSENEL